VHHCQDADSALVAELDQQFKQIALVLKVEMDRRFIEQKVARVARQCHSQHDSLLLTTGEVTERPLGQCRNAGRIHRPFHGSAIDSIKRTKEMGICGSPQFHHRSHTKSQVLLQVLWNDRHRPRPRSSWQATDVHAVELHRATPWGQDAAQEAKERAFAGAIATGKSEHLSLVEAQ
jgi:hypothetical protein